MRGLARCVLISLAATRLLACDSTDDDGPSALEAIEAACEAYIQHSAECGFVDEVEPEIEACVEDLSATRETDPACTDADVVLYECLAEAECEGLAVGGVCEAEIDATQDACGDIGGPEIPE